MLLKIVEEIIELGIQKLNYLSYFSRKKFCHNCLLKFYGELFCFPHGITEDPQIFDVHSLPKTSVKVAPTSPGSNGRRGSVSAEIVSALVSLKDRDPTHESKEKHKDFFRMIINNITSSTAPCSIDDIVDTDDVAVLKEVRDLVSYKLDVLDFVDVLYWICPACRDLCKCIACQRSKLLHAQSAAANEKKTTTLAKRESSSSPTFQTPNNKESKFKLRKISPVGFVYGVSGGAYRNTALLKAFSCMKSWPSIPVPRRIFPQVLSKEICSGIMIYHILILLFFQVTR